MTSVAQCGLAGHNTDIRRFSSLWEGLKEAFSYEGKCFWKHLSDHMISITNRRRRRRTSQTSSGRKWSYPIAADIFYPLRKKHRFRMLRLMQDRRRRQKDKTESAGKSSRVEHLSNKHFLNALCYCLSRNAAPAAPTLLSILCGRWRRRKKKRG